MGKFKGGGGGGGGSPFKAAKKSLKKNKNERSRAPATGGDVSTGKKHTTSGNASSSSSSSSNNSRSIGTTPTKKPTADKSVSTFGSSSRAFLLSINRRIRCCSLTSSLNLFLLCFVNVRILVHFARLMSNVFSSRIGTGGGAEQICTSQRPWPGASTRRESCPRSTCGRHCCWNRAAGRKWTAG